jgi:signal transduction histidine kinase
MTMQQDAQAERERRLVEAERGRAVSECQQIEERLLQERGEVQASELALREANQIMDEFLGIVSHELRTPLAIFLANVQIAGRRVERLQAGVEQRVGKDDALVAQTAAVQGLLTRAETAALRQNRLVSDLLDVSRIQSGKLEIVPERIELGQLVRQCVEEQRLAHPGRNIVLELPEEEVSVLGDADRIGQVITNYLSNALKYSGEEKPVIVLLRRDGQHARVEVRDEGPGVPPEERGHIWERFYRSPGAAQQSGSGVGLGLGLHISKTIVERHGGQVGVESVPGAGGATFWFTLPLAPDTGV